MATFSVDVCTLYTESLSYFYIRFVWPTDLENILGDENNYIFEIPKNVIVYTQFTYSLCNFYWATTTIKGRLLSSCPVLKPFFSGKNF